MTFDAGYYSVGHFSKFVLPGAKRIASTTTANLDDVAFQNPNGSLVLIIDNTSSSTQSFSTSWAGQKRLRQTAVIAVEAAQRLQANARLRSRVTWPDGLGAGRLR